METQSQSRKYWLYVLELENNCYYIGSTINLERRLKQHFSKGKKSAAFVQLNSPISVIEIHEFQADTLKKAEAIENYAAYKYIQKYGLAQVSGGFFPANLDQRKKYYNRFWKEFEQYGEDACKEFYKKYKNRYL